jgi:hypothetical protein
VSDSNGNGNGHNGKFPKSTSGIDIDCGDGEEKPITQVINTFEMAGDEVRAKLFLAIRAVVLEAREAKQQAKLYMEYQQQQIARQ